MKKIYLLILAGVLAINVNAQLSLTKVFNEPVFGDVDSRQGYDSTTVVPKSSGAAQNWNFTSLVTNTVTETNTYTMAASTPSASSFPGSTIASDDGLGGYDYYKVTAGTYETVGFATAAGSMESYTNTGVLANWPINFGYSNTDTYSGTSNYVSFVGPVNGSVTVTAPGSGTVILPGSVTYNNCLQLKVENTSVANIGTFPFTFTINTRATEYQYYSGTQKFPLVVVAYLSQTLTSSSGPTVSDAVGITVNTNALTGINDLNMEALNYNVYPNPATNQVTIQLSNEKAEEASVMIVNNLGQVVKNLNLGKALELDHNLATGDLPAGIYYIKVSCGERITTKKLIIQ
jgi:hypothetical protein